MLGTHESLWILPLVLLGLGKYLPVFACVCTCGDHQVCDPSKGGTIFDYKAKTLNGSRTVSLSEYRGKTVLIVNYLGKILNALHEELKNYGFTVLGFPFWLSLRYVRPGNGFIPNFILFEKGDVNGDTEQGLYTFLKNSCPPVGDSFGDPNDRLFWQPLKINDIKWNFEKFLVGPDGKPLMRWFPRVPVSEVRTDVLKYFRQYLSQYTQNYE
uniref:glutathione peroxidase n=1 Tax=Esox lucius TaxID=8010 RepID=A0AAY5L552_ESOLU